MNFRKSSEGGGGGSFPIQKFMLQIFAIIKGYFGHEFWKKSATLFSENEGGGSRAVYNFSEKIHPFWYGYVP